MAPGEILARRLCARGHARGADRLLGRHVGGAQNRSGAVNSFKSGVFLKNFRTPKEKYEDERWEAHLNFECSEECRFCAEDAEDFEKEKNARKHR